VNLLGIFGQTAKDAQIEAFRFEEAVFAITEAAKNSEDPFSALANGLLHIAREGDLTVAQFEALAAAAGLGGDQFEDFGDIVIAMGEDMGLPQEILDELADAIYGTGDAAADTAPEIEDLGDEADTTATKLKTMADRQREATRAILDALNPVSNAASAIGRMNDAQDRLIDLQEDAEASTADIAEAQFDYALSLFEAQAALENIDPTDLQGSIEAIASALKISDDEARNLLETLGILDGTQVTTVINTTIRRRDISDQDPLADAERTTIGFGGGRASGGPVSAGMAYMVGERGPEMIVPSQSGYVIPADLTAAMGGQVNFTVIVPDAVTASHFESLVRQNHSLTRGGLRGGAR
jgi:hypothetical protein